MLTSLINKTRGLSRRKKQIILILLDIFLIIFSLLGSFSLRLSYFYWPDERLAALVFLYPILAIPIFYFFGLYNTVIRFIGFNSIWELIKIVSFVALVWSLIVILSGIKGIPRSVTLINWLLLLVSVIGFRLLSYWILYKFFPVEISKKKVDITKICIYGAGKAGSMLASTLSNNSSLKIECFIDDDKSLSGKLINGLKVFPANKIDNLINRNRIDEIILAIPSISRSKRKKLIENLVEYNISVKTIPDLNEIYLGNVKISDLKEISIEDLLRRDEIVPDENLMSLNVKSKNVLITGAGGSIGFELCKEIAVYKPKKIVLFELNEYALFTVEKYMKKYFGEISVIPILGNVTNYNHLKIACKKFEINTIYHAAAYKHVPLIELNVIEGVFNNIIGTLNCINICEEEKINSLVMVSTDKAVRPSNLMGASKRFSEMLMQSISYKLKNDSTKFISVRFGNVLGSSGSVVPLFTEQIRNGGPLTVTHPDITRYFMTKKEAAQLVIQAGALGKGGEIFLLDMGKPVKILELAKKMIHLSGLEVKDENNLEGDIEIIISGLRPGEKLYEELLIDGKSSNTEHSRIFIANESSLGWSQLNEKINLIRKAKNDYNVDLITKVIKECVPELNINSNNSDLLQ